MGEEENTKLKKSLNATHLMELSVEKDEYTIEIQRLRGLLKDKNEELENERRLSGNQRRDMSHFIQSSSESELRNEIKRLSAGYQELLGKIAVGGDGPTAGKQQVISSNSSSSGGGGGNGGVNEGGGDPG